MSTTQKLVLVKCPRRWDPSQAPTKQDVPRLRHASRTSPEWPAYAAEQLFDANVFRALMVGGLGNNKPTPTRGENMLVLIFGAIRLVCLGEGVDPKSFDLLLSGEAVYGGWELVWEALETGKVHPTIAQALRRLLVPSTEPGQNDADDASSTNEILRRFWSGPFGSWWECSYYTARHQSSCLSDDLVKRGPGLEKFKAKERASLELLIEGVKTMQPLVNAAFSR